ncbi:MAG: protein kinase [Nostoc sp.]|uniref:bifunctional serine/threonine-protein kinase/ABC transporter substrate-binding protein n=1 Tax=Nostoc sp. TaxID=1180 RepID=UPI002FF70535
MEVYCTRPNCPNPENTISSEYLNSNNAKQEIYCAICNMPLILQERFVALSFLGSGGFGRTFKAQDLHFPYKKRVIKQLHPITNHGQILTSKDLKQREEMFRKEAITLENLCHARIPRLLDFFTKDVEAKTGHVQSFFYLVQDYIEGENLDKELNARLSRPEPRKFLENEVINILKEILNILKYIHNPDDTNGVIYIHRDIKPANIMRSSTNNRLYLIDFGAVKQILQGLEVETTSIVLDSRFAPPEQFRGQKLSPASDLYATATTCLCLLTGNKNPNQLLEESSLRDIVTVSDQNFAKALDMMLKHKSINRPQSAQEVLNILSGEPDPDSLATQIPDSDPPPQPRMLSKFLDWVRQLPRRWRLIISLGFSFLLGIASTVAFTVIFSPKPSVPLHFAKYFSRGEESLIAQLNAKAVDQSCKKAYNLKQEGMKAFKKASLSGNNNDFQEAYSKFTESIAMVRASSQNSCISDPETFIYQYNSKVAQATSARNLPTIAVVIPNMPEDNIALEILRGVAQVLQEQDTNLPLFQILLASHNNIDQEVKKLAGLISDQNIPEEFNYFNKSQILGVIGRYTSKYLFNQNTSIQQNVEGVGEIYGKKQLVLIAPTSTVTRTINSQLRITNQGRYLHRYVFRTAYDDSIAASNLSTYVWDDLKINNVLIIYDSKDIYSQSLAVEFQSKLIDKNKEGNYDLCDVSASINNALFCKNKLKNSEIQALMLAAPNVNYNEYLDIIRRVTRRKVQIFAGDNLYKPIQISANKITIAVSFHADNAKKSFNDKTEELWGIRKVSWRTMTSYDAAQVFVQALKNNNNLTRQSIFNKLNDQENFFAPGATTEVRFDENHDRKAVTDVGVLVQLNKSNPNSDDNSDEYGFTLWERPEINNP